MDDKRIEAIVQSVLDKNIQSVCLHVAKQMMNYLEVEAKKRGLTVVMAVTNSSGYPIGVHAMDHAFIASYDVALSKAYTVVALKMSTEALKAKSLPGESLYGIQFSNQGKLSILGGGIPLIFNNKVIGGLGISGASEEEDIQLAHLGEQYFKEVICGNKQS